MKNSCEDREIDMVQATCGLINLALKDRYKTGDKLTGFGAIDFGNTSFIQFLFFFLTWKILFSKL